MARRVDRVYVELSSANVKWVKENYPPRSLTGILDMLLEKFVTLQKVNPIDIMSVAARETKDEFTA